MLGVKNCRVIVVDDDPNLLAALRRALRRLQPQWRISFATDPRCAKKIIAAEEVHVLVSDIAMPHINGLDLARSVRASSPNTQVILLTGKSDLDVALTAINDIEVFRFYIKPCPVEELVDAVKAALSNTAPEAETAMVTQFRELAVYPSTTGIIVLERGGRVVFLNARSAEIVSAKDGLVIGPGNIIQAIQTQETTQLHSLLDEVLHENGRQSRALTLSRPSLLRPYAILLTRLVSDIAMERAALLVTDPEYRIEISIDIVEKLFGLTNSESRLTCALASGLGIADAAQSMGITLNTARTYLKVIFSKTGTGRQAELVRLILMSPAIVTAK